MTEGPGRRLDRLAVRGIEVRGHHGVLDVERRDGQVFIADLVLELDTRDAAGSDDLQDTVDYGSLVARVAGVMGSDPVNLIETLAERIARTCLEDRRVRSVEVTVHKPDAPIEATFADVTLTIHRTDTGADRD
ncbi:MAG: dihydroneopterin aldolase [Nocardioidaceae bacterium]